MYKLNIFFNGILLHRERMEHLPRTGETIRLSDVKYGTVTEVIWCFDEASKEGQRINLRVEELK